MKKVNLFSFILSILFLTIGMVSIAQDKAKSNTKTNQKNTSTTVKSNENKKSHVTASDPSSVAAPVYTPRPATSVEPKKKLPKTNPISEPK